jgi:ribosomal protein S27AE
MRGTEPFPTWATLGAEVQADLVAWRAAHPHATLGEIEAAVQAALSRLHTQYLGDLIHTSGATDPTTAPVAERARCPRCGGVLAPRGWQGRTVLTAGQPTPVHLHRRYMVCTACGSGVFPP